MADEEAPFKTFLNLLMASRKEPEQKAAQSGGASIKEYLKNKLSEDND